MEIKGSILIVDDEQAAVDNLVHVCSKEGYEVTSRTTGSGAIDVLEKKYFDVVLTDLRMEKVDGLAVLRRVRELQLDTAVVMITGFATVDSAVEAMKAGAFHYIAKPFRLDEVRETVRHAMELVSLKKENRQLKEQLNDSLVSPSIVTQDPVMQKLLEMAKHVAPTDTNVHVSGETGTGKELFAKLIHSSSNRKDKTFLAVNCGAFQEELLANELFGHEKGAFTGATETRIGIIEAADGGTLFLDEISEMSLGMQVKLLRVLQEGEVQRLGSTKAIKVDVRFITATHRNLQNEVAAGRFRQDLYYRLDVIGIHLPPLSERKDDIPLLAYYFLKKHALKMGRSVEDIDTEALSVLHEYTFPGNIRELENIIQRALVLTTGNSIRTGDLPPVLLDQQVHIIRQENGKFPSLEEREKDYIKFILEHCNQNRTKAAEILGIDRVSLWRKLKKLGLSEEN